MGTEKNLIGPLIFVVGLLASFSYIVTIFSNSLYAIPEQDRKIVELKEEYGGSEIFYSNITDSDNVTLVKGGAREEVYVEQYDVHICIYWNNPQGADNLWIKRFKNEWWGLWTKYWEIKPFPLKKSEVLKEEENNVSRITMTDDTYHYYIEITFDSASYDSLEEAWDNGELLFWVGMGYQEWSSKISAWTIISQILLFQTPEIGTTELTYLIGIILWSMIVFLIVAIISMILPF